MEPDKRNVPAKGVKKLVERLTKRELTKYGVPDWQKKRPPISEEQIQAGQRLVHMSTDELARIRQQARNEVKAEMAEANVNPDFGNLAQIWLDNNGQVGTAKKSGVPTVLNKWFQDYEAKVEPKNLTSSELGITYPEKKAFDRRAYQAQVIDLSKKLDFTPTKEALNEVKDAFGLQGRISNDDLKILLELDDWPDIFTTASKLKGKDQLKRAADYMLSSGTLSVPARTAISYIKYFDAPFGGPDISIQRNVGIVRPTSLEHINLDALARLIDPVNGVIICPDADNNLFSLFPSKMAIEIPVITGVDGYAVIHINTGNFISTGSGAETLFYRASAADSVYNPATGGITNTTTHATPFNNAGDMNQVKLSGISGDMQFTESALELNGNINTAMYYGCSTYNDVSLASERILSNMTNCNYSAAGSVKASSYGFSLPASFGRQLPSAYSQYGESGSTESGHTSWVMVIQSTTVAKKIGTFYMDVGINYSLNPLVQATFQGEFNSACPETLVLLKMILARFPSLLNSGYIHRQKLIEELRSMDSSCSFDEVVRSLKGNYCEKGRSGKAEMAADASFIL